MLFKTIITMKSLTFPGLSAQTLSRMLVFCFLSLAIKCHPLLYLSEHWVFLWNYLLRLN